MTEITDNNFAEGDFTAADLVKFELIKSEQVEDLNKLAELLNKIVAAKVAKLSEEKDEFYGKQLTSKELESDIFYKHFPCGYFSTDVNGIINKINDTLLVWLGYAKEDIIGKVTWQSLLSVGGKMYFETHYSPLLQMQGFVQEISFEMVKKDKNRLPILINTKQIRDENGKVQINYSTVFNVSQRKSYEKELLIAKRTAEDQNELIEYTFRNASTPIYYVLEDASIYDFNDIAAENLGYTSEELHTLKIYDLDINYDEKKWASVWAKLKAEKKITVETQHKKKDGSLLDVIITANYVKYGDIELKCSYVQDVTEKKKQEKELKLVDFTFNNSATPIFLVNEDSSIYNINEAAAKGLGYSQEELKGKKIIEIDDNFDKDKWALHWADVKAKGSITIETTHTKKDGTISNLIININYLKQEDLELLCSYAIDITEKKKLEQQLNLLDYSYKHTDSAIFFLDVNGLYIDFNQATANMLGYSYEEFRGKTIMDVNPMVTKESWVNRWEELKDVPNQNFQAKLRRKDGTLIDVEINTNSIELNGAVVNFGFYKDITEKKKLEDNLKLSAFTIDNAAWGLAYVKADGTLYNCNLAFAKLYGNTSLEEMKTKTAFDFGSAYTTDSWKQYWNELKQKKSLHYIVKRTKKDGTIIDLEINANMIQFGDLELDCIYVNDITEKKKAEAEIYSTNELLQLQTNRLLLATKSAKLGIWDRDLENNSIFWDDKMYELYGIAPNEFKTINEGWMARLHEEDRAKIQNEMQLNLTNKNEFNSEFRIVWNDSSIRYIRTTGYIERVDGKPKRLIGVSWDVTAEKENIQHLKLLESVIVNTKDSILITEAEPFDLPEPRIIFVNPAFEKMTGYTSEEVIGLTPRLLQNEDTDREQLHKLRIAMNKWEPCEITVSNTKKNGEKFWNNFCMNPIANEKGWFTHWIAVERDVTNEMEASFEKERMMKELQENNLDLKQFSYITTHNLRAPLTNLLLICKLINLQKIEDPSTLKLIEGLKKSTYQLNETLNDLINVLIVKENTDLKLEELSCEEILDKVKTSISEIFSDSKTIIETDFSDVPTVRFTKVYLESIFLNLITNSIKYRHPERNPIVKIKTIKDATGKTKLTFTDNGIGMDMSRVKHKIFGFHQRFHKNAESKGIGLFLIKSQINALGSQIVVDSEVNIGTTFTITFK